MTLVGMGPPLEPGPGVQEVGAEGRKWGVTCVSLLQTHQTAWHQQGGFGNSYFNCKLDRLSKHEDGKCFHDMRKQIGIYFLVRVQFLKVSNIFFYKIAVFKHRGVVKGGP